MKKEKFNPVERAKQKQASRDEDQRRLDAGEVSPSELRRENAFIRGSGFSAKKIGFNPRYAPENGDRWFSPGGSVGKADGSIEWSAEDLEAFEKQKEWHEKNGHPLSDIMSLKDLDQD